MSRFTPACYAVAETHSNHLTCRIMQLAFVPYPITLPIESKQDYDRRLSHNPTPILIEA